MSRSQSRLSAFGFSTRGYLGVVCPHFHVCNGARPTASEDSPPAFWQYEAWEVREMVMDHVQRLVEEEVR